MGEKAKIEKELQATREEVADVINEIDYSVYKDSEIFRKIKENPQIIAIALFALGLGSAIFFRATRQKITVWKILKSAAFPVGMYLSKCATKQLLEKR